MVSSTDTAERQHTGKSTLYCPNCPHESPIGGDWIVHSQATALDYECPDCGETVQSRSEIPNLIAPA